MVVFAMKSIKLEATLAAPAPREYVGELRGRQTAKVVGGWLKDWDGAGQRESGRLRAKGFVPSAGQTGNHTSSYRVQRPASRDPIKRQASRRSQSSVKKATVSERQQKKKKVHGTPEEEVENELGDDAFEALFAQLEMDLEADDTSDIEDFTEEELNEFENELSIALTDIEYEEAQPAISTTFKEVHSAQQINEFDRYSVGQVDSAGPSLKPRREKEEEEEEFIDVPLDDFEDEEEEQRIVDLQPWQLKKLAAAVELGRRKVNIKALCAEIGLDRFDVLAWLKDPPPELLMQSAAMDLEEDAEDLPSSDVGSAGARADIVSPKENVDMPDARRDWTGQKRLRKENEATFELVYRKTHRPSNAMVQNMVELTHVPRKRIVEWFEERRKKAKPPPKFEALR